MLRIRSFAILCVVTLLVIVAAIAVHEDSGAMPGAGEHLFPDLLAAVNEVEKIRVTSAGKSFTLERSSGRWLAADRSGYPANADKVHSLIVGAAGLKRIEPKTEKPELYARLGLEEGEGSGASSPAVAYVLEGTGGRKLAAWITGRAAPSKGDPEASEIYVRLPEDPQSWLVEGKLPRDRALVDWLDQTIVDIDRKRVREVRVLHRDGEEVVVYKKTFGETDFLLADMPADTDVNGQWRINDIGRAFTRLELADVQPRDAVSESDAPSLRVIMHTFDGLKVNLKLYQNVYHTSPAGKSLCVLSASYEDALRDETEAKLSAAEVREEASALNEKWQRWAYTLPDFKTGHLAQKRETLLKDKAAEGEGSSG